MLKPFIWIFFQLFFIIFLLTHGRILTEARSVHTQPPRPVFDNNDDVLISTSLGKIRGLKQVKNYFITFVSN